MPYGRDPADREFKQRHHHVQELLVSARQPSSVALGATPSHLNIATDLLTRCILVMPLNIPFLY